MGKRGGQLFSCHGNEIWLRFYAFELTLLLFRSNLSNFFVYNEIDRLSPLLDRSNAPSAIVNPTLVLFFLFCSGSTVFVDCVYGYGYGYVCVSFHRRGIPGFESIFCFFLKRKKNFFRFLKKIGQSYTKSISCFFSFGKSLFCLSIVQHIYCSFFVSP